MRSPSTGRRFRSHGEKRASVPRVEAVAAIPALFIALLLPWTVQQPADARTGFSAAPLSAIRTYVESLGSRRALAASQPGSPASALARHDLALAQAFAANHQRPGPQRKQFRNGTAVVCPTSTTSGPRCTTLSQFQADARGRIRTFAVNDSPLASRVVIGSPQNRASITGPAGPIAIVGLYSAYQTGPGQLVAICDFASNRAANVGAPGAAVILQEDAIRYDDSQGHTVSSDSVLNQRAPTDPLFPAQSKQNVLRFVLFFPNSALGGQLAVSTTGQPPSPELVGSAQLAIG